MNGTLFSTTFAAGSNGATGKSLAGKSLAAAIILSVCLSLSVRASAEPGRGVSSGAGTTGSLLLDDAFISDARQAIDSLYNRRFDASMALLSSWKERYPDHPVWPMWEAMNAWWPVLIDLENKSHDDDFLDAAQKVVDYCDTLLDEDEDYLDARIVRSVMYGQIARYYSNRERWYRSFRNGRRALRDFFHIEETHPDIPDLNFGIGMYRYFSAFLVEEYSLARALRWMLPSGDREEGLQMLEKASQNSIFLGPEAIFFLGHINLHFEDKPDTALSYLEHLYEQYPRNTYYRRLYVRSLFRTNMKDDALEAIRESLAFAGDVQNSEMSVLREEMYLTRGRIHYYYFDYAAAEEDLKKALAESEKLQPFAKRGNLLTALYYLGELAVRSGDREMARFYFSRAATPDTGHMHSKESRKALNRYNLK